MRFLSTVCHSTHPDPRPRLRTGTRGVSEISHRTRDEQTDLRRRREMPASESSWRSRPGRGCRACMAPDHQSNRRPMRHCSRALWRPIDSRARPVLPTHIPRPRFGEARRGQQGSDQAQWSVDHCARSSAGRVIPIRSDMVCGEECEEWTPGSQDSILWIPFPIWISVDPISYFGHGFRMLRGVEVVQCMSFSMPSGAVANTKQAHMAHTRHAYAHMDHTCNSKLSSPTHTHIMVQTNVNDSCNAPWALVCACSWQAHGFAACSSAGGRHRPPQLITSSTE